jgi:hypothetical protein
MGRETLSSLSLRGLLAEASGRRVKRIFAPREHSRLSALIASLVVINFWPISAAERTEIHEVFKTTEIRRLVTSLKGRDEEDRVEVLDAAYWVKGCSSLGRLRFFSSNRNRKGERAQGKRFLSH